MKEERMGTKFVLGFVGSVFIAGAAYLKRSLSRSGMIAAVLLGTFMYMFGDIRWYGLLIAFFVSSSLLSHRKKAAKQEVEKQFAKTGTRDWLQVAANGGLGLVAVIGAFFAGGVDVWYTFYIGVLAAVTSDTWATEIGVLSKRKPRHIFTWRKVEPGTSGGISRLGLLASLAGGIFIGGMAVLFIWFMQAEIPLRYITAGVLGGVAGSLVDSAIGAAWQQMYRCEICSKETERKIHCDHPTYVIKGCAWCTNDVVNFLASLVGGVVAIYFG
jgi:uncharacterized protein (TIGR00297 family)